MKEKNVNSEYCSEIASLKKLCIKLFAELALHIEDRADSGLPELEREAEKLMVFEKTKKIL